MRHFTSEDTSQWPYAFGTGGYSDLTLTSERFQEPHSLITNNQLADPMGISLNTPAVVLGDNQWELNTIKSADPLEFNLPSAIESPQEIVIATQYKNFTIPQYIHLELDQTICVFASEKIEIWGTIHSSERLMLFAPRVNIEGPVSADKGLFIGAQNINLSVELDGDVRYSCSIGGTNLDKYQFDPVYGIYVSPVQIN